MVAEPARRRTGPDPVELVHLEAEFHAPDWILGQSTIAELADGTLLCRCRRSGSDSLVRLAPGPAGADAPGWTLTTLEQPCVSLAGVAAADDGSNAYVLGATPSEAHCVLELSLGAREAPRRLSTGPSRRHDPRTVSVARPYVAAAGPRRVPGQVFAPASPDIEPEAPPPLVVFCHGGPTGSFEPGFDPVVQFFTSRGLAVAGVDYRGSSGYGREYRERLAGEWGVADVEDCAAFAQALATDGLVDGTRMAIRGTSAGGLTALGALVRTDLFAGAASWYGVTDLESLAADTHDFESRYLDSLVGPWPAARPLATGSARRSTMRTGSTVGSCSSRVQRTRSCRRTSRCGSPRCSASTESTAGWSSSRASPTASARPRRSRRASTRNFRSTRRSSGVDTSAFLDFRGGTLVCAVRRPAGPLGEAKTGRPLTPRSPRTVNPQVREVTRNAAARTRRTLRRLSPEWRDIVLYGASAAFAAVTAVAVSIPLYRQWGQMAVGPVRGRDGHRRVRRVAVVGVEVESRRRTGRAGKATLAAPRGSWRSS